MHYKSSSRTCIISPLIWIMSDLLEHASVSIELMKCIYYFTSALVVSPHYSTSPEASVVSPFFPTESFSPVQVALGVDVSLL